MTDRERAAAILGHNRSYEDDIDALAAAFADIRAEARREALEEAAQKADAYVTQCRASQKTAESYSDDLTVSIARSEAWVCELVARAIRSLMGATPTKETP